MKALVSVQRHVSDWGNVRPRHDIQISIFVGYTGDGKHTAPRAVDSAVAESIAVEAKP